MLNNFPAVPTIISIGLMIIWINLAISTLVHLNVSSPVEGSVAVSNGLTSPEELVEEWLPIQFSFHAKNVYVKIRSSTCLPENQKV